MTVKDWISVSAICRGRPYLPVTVYKYLTSENKQVTFKHNFDDERKINTVN